MANFESTSYGKVYNLLYKTADFQQMVRLRLQEIENVEFDDIKCEVNMYYTPMKCEHQWSFRFGDRKFFTSRESPEIPGLLIFLEDEVMDLVEKNFGPNRQVKTRNCQVEVLKSGKEEKRSRYGRTSKPEVPSLREWMARKVRDEYHETFERANAKMTAWVQQKTNDGSLENAKNKAFARKAMTEVRDTLRKWSFVGDEVLKEALQEFVCADILDL